MRPRKTLAKKKMNKTKIHQQLAPLVNKKPVKTKKYMMDFPSKIYLLLSNQQ